MDATPHVREHRSLLAAREKQALVWIARRLPAWVTPDHLSGLGLSAMATAGVSFWLAQFGAAGIVGVVLSLAVNWFGDSLDGTLARVRRQERPRFGYYVDHVIDLAGTACLLAGIAASGFMSPIVALALLAAYLLVSAEVYLATHARGVFRMSFAGFGPTELRIVLAAGAVCLLRWPDVSPFGLGPWRLFDVGGVVATVGLSVAFVTAAWRNTRALLHADRPSRVLAAALIMVVAAGVASAEASGPGSATIEGWQRYVAATDARIARERRAGQPLPVAVRVAQPAEAIDVEAVEMRDATGRVLEVPGGLVHHWRGRVFVPGPSLETVLSLVKRAETHARQPDVRAARVVSRSGDDGLVLFLRLTRSQLVTATYDTEHEVRYERIAPGRVVATSRAMRIVEVEAAGTARERLLGADEDRGFLWRLQAWWDYRAVPGGVVIVCESASLSRTIPVLLRPVAGPLVTRFARDSMTRTLTALRTTLQS